MGSGTGAPSTNHAINAMHDAILKGQSDMESHDGVPRNPGQAATDWVNAFGSRLAAILKDPDERLRYAAASFARLTLEAAAEGHQDEVREVHSLFHFAFDDAVCKRITH